MTESNPNLPAPQPTELDRQLEFMANRDLNLLKPEEKAQFLYGLHKAMGVSPFSRAFDFIKTNDGRTILYANRAAADQLANANNIESEVLYAGPLRLGERLLEEIFTVELKIKKPLTNELDGSVHFRCITSVGAVAIGIRSAKGEVSMSTGEGLANAYMKAYTKAWRRGVLQIMGCGFPDETETDSFASNAISQPSASTPPTESPAPTPVAPRLLTPPAEPTSPDPITTVSAVPPIQTNRLPQPVPAARPPRR